MLLSVPAFLGLLFFKLSEFPLNLKYIAEHLPGGREKKKKIPVWQNHLQLLGMPWAG